MRSEQIRGPFQPEGLSPSTYLVPVGIKGRLGALFNAVGDDAGNSDLRLWVNGEEWGPAHAAHATIRLGNTRAFSHWNGNVHVSLSANDHSTELRASYSVRLPPIALLGLVLVAPGLLLGHLALFGPRRRGVHAARMRQWAPRLLLVFPAVSWLVIAGGISYFTTILYGVYAGYALPTAAVFDLIPGARRLPAIEPYAPIAILIFAAFGAVASWLANFALLPRPAVRRAEIAQLRLWARWGLLSLVALMIFSVSSVGWNGQIRATDFNYVSLAGLVPNSDAANYLTAISDQIQFGTWNVVGSHRPLAGAFRELTAFAARYSYVGMLLLQTVLVALMLSVTASRIASWRGVWASIAFVGLVTMLARPYLFTLMTEPLGMIWSLFCALFFVEALRRQSLSHALVALLALTIGLWTRMGAMFTVPFLALWASLMFAETATGRFRVLLASACAVFAVLAFNAMLAFLYGAEGTFTGANFAYTICGLSLGADWGVCTNTYAAQLMPLEEREQAMFLLARAWENFWLHPEILVRKMLDNASEFIFGWPRFFLTGGTTPHQPTLVYVLLATWALVPGVVYVLRSRSSWIERTFWLALWASVISSAAFVFADAGWRNLHVTNTLLAAFVALGFVAPGNVVTPAGNRWITRSQNGVIVVAAMAALFLIVPTLARLSDRIELPTRVLAGSPQPNIRLVAAGRWLTGFLVIADGVTRSISMPSLRFSEFARMVRLLNLEAETGPFLSDAETRVPFAFVTMPDIDQRNTTALYIAPPDVLRPDVQAWRFLVPQLRPKNIIRVVEQAEPLPLR